MSADFFVSFGAQTDDLESGFALAKAQTQALQREMQQLAKEMVKAGADADAALGAKLNSLGSALAEAKARTSELSAELHTHATSALEAGSAIDKLGEFARRGLEFAGVTLGVDAFKEWIASTIEAAEQTERMAAKLGASVGEVQQIGAVAVLTGTDMDRLGTAMERLQLGLAKSASATSPVRAALAALGVEAEHFRSLSIPQQMDELAQAAARFADGATKTAAFQALGRQFVELLPMLDRGKQGFDELTRAARETGVIMSDQDVKALAETKEASSALGLAVTALGQDLTLALNGAIGESIAQLTKLVEWLDRALHKAEEFAGTINGLVGRAAAALGDNEVLLGLAGTISTDGTTVSRDVTVHRKPQVPEMQIGGGGRGGDKAAREEAQAQIDAFNEEVKAAQDAAKQKEKALDDALSHHRVSVGEWLKDSVQTLNDEVAQVRKVYDEELSIVGLTVAQIARIKAEEADKLREINDQIIDDERKAADAAAKSWEDIGKAIETAVNSQLTSVLNHTESVRTALAKIAEDLAMQFLKIEEAAAMKGLADQLSSHIGDVGSALASLASMALKAIGAGAGENSSRRERILRRS